LLKGVLPEAGTVFPSTGLLNLQRVGKKNGKAFHSERGDYRLQSSNSRQNGIKKKKRRKKVKRERKGENAENQEKTSTPNSKTWYTEILA